VNTRNQTTQKAASIRPCIVSSRNPTLAMLNAPAAAPATNATSSLVRGSSDGPIRLAL
jgi:hypothetical protein